MIWSVAGQATRSRPQNGRAKFKVLPNLTVGLPQYWTVHSVQGQFSEDYSHSLGHSNLTPLVAIDQAIVANVDPQQIAAAQQLIQQGDASVVGGDLASAAQSFQHAWQT